MNGMKWIFALGLLLGLFAALPLGAANPPNSAANWDNLKTLAPGEKTGIVLNGKKSYDGKFQSLAENAIVVRLAAGGQTFTRDSVLRVSTKGQSHRLRNAVIGVAVGAGIGAGAGAAQSDNDAYVFAYYVPFLAVVGALGGAVIPSGGWHDVYRAR